MTIPTFSRRRTGDASQSTSPTSDEEIKRRWNFVQGLWTKALRVYAEGSSAGKALVAKDADGNVTFSSIVPNTATTLTALTTSVTGTILGSGEATGVWLATAYAQCTVAGTGGAVSVTMDITDDVGATSNTIIDTLDLNMTGRKYGVIPLRCSGGGIDYTATVTGGSGGPEYSLHIGLIRMADA